MNSAFIKGKRQAKLDMMVTHLDTTHGNDMDNEPKASKGGKQPNWTPTGRSEGAEGA